jgi:hypothetical protein
MTLRNRLADLVLIVGAVSGEGGNGIGDLVEQRASHRGIVDILPGHHDDDDLAADGIDADMQLAPGPAAARTGGGTCRAFRSAIRRLRQASGQGCPQANAVGRFLPAGVTAP